jgi:hypothetical protein
LGKRGNVHRPHSCPAAGGGKLASALFYQYNAETGRVQRERAEKRKIRMNGMRQRVK